MVFSRAAASLRPVFCSSIQPRLLSRARLAPNAVYFAVARCARVMERQTCRSQKPMPKGVWVRIPPRAPFSAQSVACFCISPDQVLYLFPFPSPNIPVFEEEEKKKRRIFLYTMRYKTRKEAKMRREGDFRSLHLRLFFERVMTMMTLMTLFRVGGEKPR